MFLIKIIFSAFVMAIGLYLFQRIIDLWINYSAFSQICTFNNH